MANQYEAVIKGKEESGEGQFTLTVDIPSFKSKFPTKLTRVPAADAARLEVGKTYGLLLERGNPRPGKKADSTTPWDYYWNYRGIGTDIGGARPVQPQTRSSPFDVWGRESSVDPTRRSIERQTALKAAVEYAGYHTQAAVLPAFDVLSWATAFAEWLALPDGPQPAPQPQDDQGAAPAVPGQQQTPTAAVPHVVAAPQPVGAGLVHKTLGELLTWARETYGLDREKVAAACGHTLPSLMALHQQKDLFWARGQVEAQYGRK